MAETVVERFAYGSVLEALSRGLYPDKRHIIREFVQNSYDSLCELRRGHPKIPLSPIGIKIEPPSIFIADSGLGMTEGQVKQYRYLGFSQKERAKHAGFRGIGKYSGSAVAAKLIVDTSPMGVPRRYQVIIHADRMMAQVQAGKNPPLEELLKEHSEFSETSAPVEDHYTFVELHQISKDSDVLMKAPSIIHYLARTAPVPMHPDFQSGSQIHRKLAENIPDFMAAKLLVNGTAVYKPFFPHCNEPEFEVILFDDRRPDVLAFCWYCQNTDKGQLELKEDAGLVFRVKNIAVGDGQLSRRMLWRTTPERAAYFFGEIHVLDPEVIPSSDRTDFEDNDARQRLTNRCLRISSILRNKAGKESAVRRFEEVLDQSNQLVSRRRDEVKAGALPVEVKEQVVFEIQKIQEDVQKRLKGPKTPTIARRAKRLMGRARRMLTVVKGRDAGFIDLQRELKFDSRLRALYKVVLEVLKEEFRHQPDRLERVIRRIHEAARARLSS
jgi:molecular chaperone HtpG